ncbi:MAG TPA: glycerate kinase [Gaiellaceae bacterium]|nr:glycerate kinase [Gaiellaceae bacterium]
MLALASPASLKGVLSPSEAAAALAAGLRSVAGVEAREAPVADGGEGTAAVLEAALGGEWRQASVSDPLGRPVHASWLLLDDGTAVVEVAAAVGLPLVDPDDLDPLAASTRGLGELIVEVLAAEPSALIVCLGGTATVDGGADMREVVGDRLQAIPVRAACDVRNPLLGERGAARVFGPQKGADASGVAELERRLAAMSELTPFRNVRGAGAGGGLGAAFAALGAELVEGAELVLDVIGFDALADGATLVITGEGSVDATTFEGKAPGAVVDHCRRLGVRCELFGGIVESGIDAHALSGQPEQAASDLERLAARLAGESF